MTRQTFEAGTNIFLLGDVADRFHVVAEGEVLIRELEKVPTGSAVFGVVRFFTSKGTRTAPTPAPARAIVAVELMWIDRRTLVRVCHDNPDFALFLSRLTVSRLVQNEEAAMGLV